MKSYWIHVNGDQTSLDLREVPTPEPGPDQILLRMHAASLNRGEFIAGHGLHGKSGSSKPVGMDGAGEVVRAGANAAGRFQPGDRVMGRCAGSFSEYALMDLREAMPLPAALSWEQGASVPLTFHVAYDIVLLQGHLAAGEWVLINGVTSGVGVACLQLAKALGAQVIGTSGSPAKLERLTPLGLDVALHTRGADFHDAVMAATGQGGANLVVNTVGGSVFAENVRCAAFEGRLATVGYVDGVLGAHLDVEALHGKRLTLFGVSNKLRSPTQRAAGVPGFIRDVLPLLADGRVVPLVDKVYGFGKLAEAKASMETNQHVGKIVLAIADGPQA